MIEGIRLHHVECGPPDAPVLVLVDSLGSTLDTWDPVVGGLTGPRRVVRFDLRGHGGSAALPGPYEIADLGADILTLLDELDIARADLCGISIGGMGAMSVAATAPERVGRLILCCTSARLGTAQGWAERAALVRASGMGAVADAVVGRWLRPAYASAYPDRVAGLRAMIASTDPEAYAAWCGALERMDLRPILGDIAAPTLVIAGAEDPAVPMADIRELGDTIADARIEIVPESAHMPMVEQPAAVGRLIRSHLGIAGGDR